MVSILTEQNVTQSLSKLGADDIYIKPDLTGLTAGQFERSAEAADEHVGAVGRARKDAGRADDSRSRGLSHGL